MKKSRLILLLPALLMLQGLAGCTLLADKNAALHISSVHGGKLSLLPETRNPVVVVKSPKGIGRARLRVEKALPEGLIVEFPGLKQLEYVALEKNGKTLICHGTAEAELPCTWGQEWPVASLKRYAGGMTLSIPASVFAEPGVWSLQWVDYYRN